MISAILENLQDIKIKSVSKPSVSEDEILVKVEAVGICGSDVATYFGTHPYKVPPTVLGHEFFGIVEKVGEKVDNVKLGDQVCSSSYSPCDKCTNCVQGATNLCQNKKNLCHKGWDGAFAEYVVLKQNMVYKINRKIVPQLGALVEPLSIGLHTAQIACKSNPQKLAVLGAGSIGQSCLITAKALGIKNIVITDIGKFKGDISRKLLAKDYVDASIHNVRITVPKLLDGMADVTIVASGYKEAVNDAIGITRNGGNIVVVSFFDCFPHVNLNECVRREISVKGASLSTNEDFKRVIAWIEKGIIDPMPMVTHEFPLSDAVKALQLFKNEPQSVGKVMLFP
jgi:2-desacetyl-2-hydroxyethyl bacteriochlorophyllide A dehydrogenase